MHRFRGNIWDYDCRPQVMHALGYPLPVTDRIPDITKARNIELGLGLQVNFFPLINIKGCMHTSNKMWKLQISFECVILNNYHAINCFYVATKGEGPNSHSSVYILYRHMRINTHTYIFICVCVRMCVQSYSAGYYWWLWMSATELSILAAAPIHFLLHLHWTYVTYCWVAFGENEREQNGTSKMEKWIKKEKTA